MIALQYNPDTLTRTLQVQATGGDGGDRSRGAAAEGRRGRDDQARGRDRRHRPARATRTATPTRSSSASTRSSRRSRRSSTRAPTTCRRTTRWPRSGALEMLPLRGAADAVRLEQAARRAGAGHRPLGHRGGVRRRLNPIRAKVSLGLRVLSVDDLGFGAPRRHAVHGATCARRRRSPARAGSVALSRARAGGRLHDRSAAGAARRRRRADDVVPADEPLRRASASTRCDPGDGDAAGAVPAPPARARGRSASRCSTRCAVVEGDRRDLLAARHLGDPELWWRLADANGVVDPRELTDAGRPAAADHAARGRPGGGRWLSARPPAAAGRARPCRCRRRARCSTRCSEVKVESRLGRDAERLRAHASRSRTARRCTRCSCSPAASSIPILRVVIAVTRRRHDDGADRRRDDPPRGPLRRRPDLDADGQGQGPDGADGHRSSSTACPYPAMPPARARARRARQVRRASASSRW